MTAEQTRAIGLSVIFHAAFLACILAAVSFVPRHRTILLDFSIGSSAPAPQDARRATVAARPPKPRANEQQMVTPVQEDPTAVPVKADRTSQDLPPVDQSPQQPDSGTSDGAIDARQTYLNAHFIGIRDRILGKLTYPPLARMRGWSGRVMVSFTVGKTGMVEDIRIEESSGNAVLDNDAMETIRKACPLPRPPVKVALIMPIVYRLR